MSNELGRYAYALRQLMLAHGLSPNDFSTLIDGESPAPNSSRRVWAREVARGSVWPSSERHARIMSRFPEFVGEYRPPRRSLGAGKLFVDRRLSAKASA